jgi:hypothetical protein
MKSERKNVRKPAASASANHVPIENALTRIRVAFPSMAKRAKRIAEYVMQNPNAVVSMSVTESADKTDTCDGSVMPWMFQGFQASRAEAASKDTKH